LVLAKSGTAFSNVSSQATSLGCLAHHLPS
jgi:hypothetical protein